MLWSPPVPSLCFITRVYLFLTVPPQVVQSLYSSVLTPVEVSVSPFSLVIVSVSCGKFPSTSCFHVVPFVSAYKVLVITNKPFQFPPAAASWLFLGFVFVLTVSVPGGPYMCPGMCLSKTMPNQVDLHQVSRHIRRIIKANRMHITTVWSATTRDLNFLIENPISFLL